MSSPILSLVISAAVYFCSAAARQQIALLALPSVCLSCCCVQQEQLTNQMPLCWSSGHLHIIHRLSHATYTQRAPHTHHNRNWRRQLNVVEIINNYFDKTMITIVITCQYTVHMPIHSALLRTAKDGGDDI